MTLHYRKYGTGSETLVILHGLFGTLDNWRFIATSLAKYTQIITVDLRNHGRSFHSDVMNYQIMLEDVAELLSHLGISKVNLLGHSMGGKVAMAFAERYPEKVTTLIVIDMAPRAYVDQHTNIIDALSAIDLQQYQQRHQVDAVLKKQLPDKSVRQFLLMNLVVANNAMHWRVNLDSIARNYHFLLEAVCIDSTLAIPSYFIRGNLSDYINQDDIDLIYETFIYSELITIDNAGHWVHAEQPESFLKIVRQILNYD